MSASSRAFCILGIALVLGCSPSLPKDEERFALEFLQLVRRDQLDEAFATLEPSLRNSAARSALQEVRRVLSGGEPIRIDTVGAQVFTSMTSGERTSSLTFQLQYASTWFLANVVVRTIASQRTVTGFHVRQLQDSLQRLNTFTLRGKGVRHLAFLAIAFVAFASSVAALVACARARLRRKALWLLISAIGAGQVLLDWTTGSLATRPVSVQLLSVSITRANEYASWLLSVSFPIGALLFFGFRRKLTQEWFASQPPGQSR